MMKKKLLRFGSVFLCATVLTCSLSACNTDAGVTMQEVTAAGQAAARDTQTVLENAIYARLFGTSTASGTKTAGKANSKEETVFVFTDANGRQDHVIINEKLKNVAGQATLKDLTTLKNIANLTGDETPVTDGAFLTWPANGNSVTYQGTTDKPAPVTMKVTYMLDGREISSEALAGRSGRVTIRFDYTNNAEKTITVNGRQQTAYVPFTVITGLLLSKERFDNIEVTNAKIVDAGDSPVVLGMTMPGMKESLDLQFEGKPLDLDLPSYFEVSADVKDFQLEMTLSVAISALLSNLDLDGLSLDSMKEDIRTLTDAGDRLADGASQLADGTARLSGGMSELTGKIPELTDGVTKLDAGAAEAANGADRLAAGASKAVSGASELNTGVNAYTDGVGQLAAGAASLDDTMAQYAAAVDQLCTSLYENQLDENLSALADGSAQLNNGLSGADGLSATLKNGMSDCQSKYNTAYREAYQLLVDAAVLQQTGGAALTEAQQKAVEAAVRQALAQKGIAAEPDITDTDAEKNPVNQMTCMIGGLCGLYATYSAAGNVSSANAVLGGLVTIAQAGAAYRTMCSTQQSLEAAGLYTGAAAMAAGLGQLQEKVGSFKGYQEGTLCSSLYALNLSAKKLKSEGTGGLRSGLSELDAKSGALCGGGLEVQTGLTALSEGAFGLSAGTAQLADGTAQLKGGAAALSAGAVSLRQGADELNEGALTLQDGMLEFNETGIQQLAGLVGADADRAVETIKQVVQLGRDYQSFAGKTEDLEGSVTFIYKTEGITG